MKLQIENFTTLLMMTVMLLAGGCSGCGQKTEPQVPIEPEQIPDEQQEITDTQQQKQSLLIYPYRHNPNVLLPFPQPVIPPQVHKSANAAAKAAKNNRLAAAKKEGVKLKFKEKETIGRNAADRTIVEAIGNLAYAQYLAHRWKSRAYPFAEKALAEKPNDYDALLTWVYLYPSRHPLEDSQRVYDSDDPERLDAVRRLYEMNPNHPYVLQELAKIIYPQHPQEALGYAQKALQLEYRYVTDGMDGICYFQLGDYENALAAFERSLAAADDAKKYGHENRIAYVKRIINDPETQKKLQTWRKENVPLMGITSGWRRPR